MKVASDTHRSCASCVEDASRSVVCLIAFFSEFAVDFGVQFKHVCRSIAAASVGALGLPVFLVCAAI